MFLSPGSVPPVQLRDWRVPQVYDYSSVIKPRCRSALLAACNAKIVPLERIHRAWPSKTLDMSLWCSS